MQQREPHQPGKGTLRLGSRALGSPPDPADGPFAIARVEALSHELRNLLDGSMRCLGLARRSLSCATLGLHELDTARRNVETVYGALERMADLVTAAMKGSASAVGSPTMNPSRPITIAEAAAHAIDVLTPEADELGVRFEARITKDAEQVPAGPLYSVLLNGLRNALEAIARAAASPRPGGNIDISITVQPIPGTEVDLLLIDIMDDGRGLASDQDAIRALDFGVTSKPGGLGVGLALAREVVREVGGSIELSRRPERVGMPRPGALLKIVYPMVRRSRAL
jgi:signal transduction histidine kinase